MPRTLLIFALTLPLAVLMGYMLSDPMMRTNMAVISIVIGMLLLPLVLAFHQAALIWFAQASMTAFFAKGQPMMWMLIAAVSLTISIASRPMSKTIAKPIFTKHLAWSLIFLAAVVIFTAKMTGGIGFQALGSSVQGGKRYVWIMLAIAGFFALTMQPYRSKSPSRDVAIFCLMPMTGAVSNIAYMLGPSFYFLFLLFPVENALAQASADLDIGFQGFKRINGFGPASVAIASFCMLRWGVKGMLTAYKPWRLAIFVAALGLGLASGFRSTLVLCVLLFLVMFLAEGLYKTRYAAGLLAVGLVSLALLGGFATKLPLSAQRALSFLPIKIDPVAARDAEGSTQWRLEMWSALMRDVPRYFWLGKGCAIDPTDLYFAQEGSRRGYASAYEFSSAAGDYHSGPLSLIIPFGIWGVIGFVWFCASAVSALWKNMKYGDPAYLNVNRFLFSLLMARLIFFVLIFGSFYTDIWALASIVGISLCVNQGVREPARVELPSVHKIPQKRPSAEFGMGERLQPI